MTTLRHSSTALMVAFVIAGAIGQNPEPTALTVGSATIAELKGEVAFHSPRATS